MPTWLKYIAIGIVGAVVGAGVLYVVVMLSLFDAFAH